MKIVIGVSTLLFSVACLAQEPQTASPPASAKSLPYLVGGPVVPSQSLQPSSAQASFYYSSLFAEQAASVAHTDLASYAEPNSFEFSYPLAKSWMLHAGYSEADRQPTLSLDSISGDAYYLGGSYKMALGWPGSTFTLNMGYASLDTSNIHAAGGICDLEDSECAGAAILTSQLSSQQATRQNSSLSAWTYGVVWLIPLGDNMAVNTSLKMSDYMENEGEVFSFDQKSTTFFNLGVQYAF